jgi:hypothetical protein
MLMLMRRGRKSSWIHLLMLSVMLQQPAVAPPSPGGRERLWLAGRLRIASFVQRRAGVRSKGGDGKGEAS